jgi:P2 family phage major capsid protein
MRNETRLQFNAYAQRLAELNHVDSATAKFSVDPSVQQTLETKIQESSAFLGRINIVGRQEMKGEKVGIGVTGPIAGRTDTTSKDRATRDVSALDKQGYECHQTNYDTHVRYALLDAWAKFPDFQTRLRDVILKRQALDRICIGFNGTSAADTTDLASNPLLQDVNIGWLQQYRANAAERVMSEVVKDSGKINIGGTSADYANMDALVMDAVASLIEPWYRNNPGLVAVLGRGLMHDKYFPLVNKDQDAQNTLATDVIISQKRVGGLQAVQVPFFPDNTILVTMLDNLSIYFQDGARRRYMQDNPKRDRIENYESSNDAYVVEDYDAGCLLENITIAE